MQSRILARNGAITNVNNFYDNSGVNSVNSAYATNNINRDERMDLVDENRKLTEKNEKLYQALLEEKESKIKMLEEMLKNK